MRIISRLFRMFSGGGRRRTSAPRGGGLGAGTGTRTGGGGIGSMVRRFLR